MSDTERIQELSTALEAEKVKYAELLKIHEDGAATDKKTIKQMQETIDSIVPPEAIYSYSTNGQSETWTVRARLGEDGKSFFHRVDHFLKYANEHGKALTQKQVIATATPAPDAASAPSAPTSPEIVSDGGTAHAVLMKIGKSYTGNKPQLQFEVEGMEHPLSYTRPVPDMMKLLAPVGKYSPEMLTEGKKYAVDYAIDWRLGDANGEGKRYRNITAVRPNK